MQVGNCDSLKPLQALLLKFLEQVDQQHGRRNTRHLVALEMTGTTQTPQAEYSSLSTFADTPGASGNPLPEKSLSRLRP